MSKKAARSMSALLSNSSHLNCLLIFTLCTLLIGNALILLVNGQCPDVSVTIAGEEHEQRTYQIDENLYDDEEDCTDPCEANHHKIMTPGSPAEGAVNGYWVQDIMRARHVNPFCHEVADDEFICCAPRQYKHNIFYYTLNEDEDGPADEDEEAIHVDYGSWHYNV